MWIIRLGILLIAILCVTFVVLGPKEPETWVAVLGMLVVLGILWELDRKEREKRKYGELGVTARPKFAALLMLMLGIGNLYLSYEKFMNAAYFHALICFAAGVVLIPENAKFLLGRA